MIHFKTNVRFTEAQAMALLIHVGHQVFAKYGYDLWITSANDGAHKSDSFHYKGLALDFRTKHVDKINDRWAIREEMAALLTPCFDVLFEDPGGFNEHLHCEYDPK